MGERQIHDLLNRVRARWRRVVVLRAIARAALAASLVLALALALGRWLEGVPSAFVALGLAGIVVAACAVLWGLWPARERPSDARVARFIEEAEPSLDDRLTSAVALASADGASRPGFAEPLIADAARHAAPLDPTAVVRPARLRLAGIQAAAAVIVLALVGFSGRSIGTRWLDTIALTFFPRPAAANAAAARDASVARPPRVTRIDLDYTFPKELGLPHRTEEDTGDIYAPAGTSVLLRIHTDRDVASGRMAFGNGSSTVLTHDGPSLLTTTITVVEDGSYRVALADASAASAAGDTEYFIRTLEDRPPDVHVVRPARDRDVTQLEEVDIEARADDDFGIAGMDLVYAVRGGPEKVVPFHIPTHAVSASATETLYLEDLNVRPGDFVSYYVRARDIGRGKRSSETKSDLFFLEVRPFDQQFKLADSQGGAGGGNQDLDGLVQAQKDIIVATWKLDRRSQAASTTSSADVHVVAKAESELKTRVEETSSAFRESTMRDPRSRAPQRQPTAGENAMTAAAAAMGKAAATLGELKTADAVPPEMEALNHLLQAQSEVKERQVQTQQAGSGNASNRSNLDLTNLFDRELQRQQRTNYESKSNTEQRDDTSTLDKIRDLARRQDELNERQKELAQKRVQMTGDEMKRELEKLTREQADLRQETEQLAQKMGSQSAQASQGRQGSQNSSGSQSVSGAQGSQGSQGSPNAMNGASEAMRNATTNLRQQDPAKASQQGAQAAERLRELAQRMESQGSGSPEDRRRALGDLQLEARQLADAQRHITSSLESGGGAASGDTLRRLAGDEERLSARAARVGGSLNDQAARAAGESSAKKDGTPQALMGAARDFERQRAAGRMKQSADAMRAAGGEAQKNAADAVRAQAAAQAEIARSLDRLADTLADASAPGDADARKLADERARAEALRTQIDKLSAEMKQPSSAGELAKLRDEYARQLQQAQQLLDQLKREDPTMAQGGMGFTFEGQGMTLSAPGTEAFKQDFAKWDDLRVKATAALSKAETSIDKRLEAANEHDRLASGVDDRAPSAYQSQVNSYFKALADRK